MEEAAKLLDEHDVDLDAVASLIKRRKLRAERFEYALGPDYLEPSVLEESTGLITDFVKDNCGWKNLTFSTTMWCKEDGSTPITPLEWRPNPLERLLFVDRLLPDFSTLPFGERIGSWQEREKGVLYGQAKYKMTVSCKKHNIEDDSTYNGKKQGIVLETGPYNCLTVYRPFIIKNGFCFLYKKEWPFKLPLPMASTLHKHHGEVMDYIEVPFMFEGEEWLVEKVFTNVCLWETGVVVP